jgi:molybdenum cofactor guanylyltransferase
MTGVILCGGDSTRMGRDKGLLLNGTHTWAALAVEKLMTLGISVLVSVNTRQLPVYSPIFPQTRLIPDDPSLSLKGPLAGLLSVHLKIPTEDLFVLACDLPLMERSLLEELFHHQRLNPKARACLYTSNGEHEPLCGIYTAPGLDKIAGLCRTGKLLKHSMKYALNQLTVDSLPIPEEKQKCFENFNYPPPFICPPGPDQRPPADAS